MVTNIADRIRYLRDRSGMTQAGLAKRLGISRSAVNFWEMSLSSPSLANLLELMTIFHVSADYLLTGEERITVDITDLDGADQEVVLRMVDRLGRKENDNNGEG